MQITNENFSIRINQDGVRKLIDDFESDIMQVFWSSQQPTLTAKDVYRVLRADQNVLHGAVLITMSRLVDKGLLSIVDTVGMANCYAASCSKEELIDATINHVVRVLFTDFPVETRKSLAAYGRSELAQKIAQLQ